MRDTQDVQFYFMHFMPYAHLPANADAMKSAWVDVPNSHFDPVEGHALYKRYLKELQLADELGFDGMVVNEHHSTLYSLMPACPLIASALAVTTKRAKICIYGTPIGITYPNRVAEEYAMIDVMSEGRVECGFPLGTGMEYWSNSVNPVYARERFRESMDILLRSWTEPGPFRYEGRFFNYKYLNPWPTPYQKPHPKMYIVGSGSEETISYAAEKGFGYSSVFVPIETQLRAFESFRKQSEQHGHKVARDSIVTTAIVYVAESEERAMAEAKEHVLYYFRYMLRTTPHYFAPPGHLSLARLRKRLSGPVVQDELTWEMLNSIYRIVLGTPDMVAEKIAKWTGEADSNRLILHLHLGDMPHWKTVKNLTLFASEVMPRLRRGAPVALGRVAAE